MITIARVVDSVNELDKFLDAKEVTESDLGEVLELSNGAQTFKALLSKEFELLKRGALVGVVLADKLEALKPVHV